MRGKTVLITGATNGIGLEAAVELARRGARMFLVGRDPGRTRKAVAEVEARSGSGEVSSFLCDFSSQGSIRELAGQVLGRLDRLDVLINNAGGVNKTRELTVDGIEKTFAVNHLGYFLLTNLLLDLLKKSAPARVVSVASIGHRRGTLDFDDLGFERGGYWIMKAYTRSKLANVLFANELARRLAGTGVTSNSLHPGSVATNIWSGAPTWAKPLIRSSSAPSSSPSSKERRSSCNWRRTRSSKGSPENISKLGKRFRPRPLAQDEALAKRLWDVSAAMVHLDEAPPLRVNVPTFP